DVLISRTQITGPEELKGKRIGVEWSAVGALMLSEVLSRSNLAYSDVKLIDIPADRQLDSWNTEKLDAIITYEPMATRLIQNGGYRVFDSKQMPEMIFDVLAIRSDVIEQHADAVRSLSAAHFSMLQRMRINPQDTAYRIASLIELTGEEVMVAFRGIEIPQLSANRQYLEADNKIIKAAVDISLLMSRNNMTNHDDNLFNLVSDDYLPVDN
ncbi:MAG: ABC transporter substrate-binding protein, partial [Gammaproteobacteria bacterium]|nr:ABC transporter substrate-binding protein [Gammaproteobacteria bacterium]